MVRETATLVIPPQPSRCRAELVRLVHTETLAQQWCLLCVGCRLPRGRQFKGTPFAGDITPGRQSSIISTERRMCDDTMRNIH